MPRIFLCLGLAFALAVSASANDWPNFRGPHGDNTVPGARIATSFPADGPKIAWTRDMDVGYAGASIVGNEVFIIDRISGEKDVLLCLNLADGAELWRWEHPVPGRLNKPGSRAVPTVTDDTVYVSGGFGQVYAIDRKTHKEHWIADICAMFDTMPPRFGYSIHPIVYGETIIVAPSSETVGVAALNKSDGSVAWKTAGIESSHSSPLLARVLDREVVFMLGANRATKESFLFGFDPKNGEPVLKFVTTFPMQFHNPIPNITVIDRDTVFFTGGYSQDSHVLDLSEGEGGTIVAKSVKTIPAGATIHPGLKVGDQLYMTAEQRRGNDTDPTGLICMNLAGDILWTTAKDPHFNCGSLILAGDTMIVQDGDSGLLRLIEPGPAYRQLAEGKIFSKPTGEELWAPLALSNGMLVTRSQNQLVCVDLRM